MKIYTIGELRERIKELYGIELSKASINIYKNECLKENEDYYKPNTRLILYYEQAIEKIIQRMNQTRLNKIERIK